MRRFVSLCFGRAGPCLPEEGCDPNVGCRPSQGVPGGETEIFVKLPVEFAIGSIEVNLTYPNDVFDLHECALVPELADQLTLDFEDLGSLGGVVRVTIVPIGESAMVPAGDLYGCTFEVSGSGCVGDTTTGDYDLPLSGTILDPKGNETTITGSGRIEIRCGSNLDCGGGSCTEGFCVVPPPQVQPIGSPLQINTYVTGDQISPAVATQFFDSLVVWQSAGQDGSGSGIFGQRVGHQNQSVQLLGPEFQVNRHTLGEQVSPAVASRFDLSVQAFVVTAWASSQDGSEAGIFAQRFVVADQAVGGAFQVNAYTLLAQDSPALALDQAGNLVAVWRSQQQDGGSSGIFGRRFDWQAEPIGTEFQVTAYTTFPQRAPAVASDASGNFVVSWESNGQDGDAYCILGRVFDSTGAPLSGEFLVNSYTRFNQRSPVVTFTQDGGFVIVWQGVDTPGPTAGIFGQHFDSLGARVGGEFQVNTYTPGSQTLPRMASDADGDFVVVWQSYGQDGDRSGAFARRFDGAAASVGSEFQVSRYTIGNQSKPAVGMDNCGDFVVTWENPDQLGVGLGIFAQRFRLVP
jgi:hypothetical protein